MSRTGIPMISAAVENMIAAAENDCAEVFRRIDAIEISNTHKIISAFQKKKQ